MRTLLLITIFCLHSSLVGADQIGDGGNSGGNGDTSAYASAAEQCGIEKQRANQVMNGRSMCGLAVAEMVECYAQARGEQNCASGAGCGNGRDYIDCKNGFLQRCDYKRVDVTSSLCRMPGAVLAYNSSTTERGKMYGHVEFLCGQDTYCSVYKEPMHKPWPWQPPAACWVPTKNGVLPIAPVLPPIDPASVTPSPAPTPYPTPYPTPTPNETETPRKSGGGAMDAIIPALGILGTLRNSDSSPKPAPAGTPLPGMSTAPLVFPGATPTPVPGATPAPVPGAAPSPTPGGENQNPRERVPDTRTQSTDGKIHIQGR